MRSGICPVARKPRVTSFVVPSQRAKAGRCGIAAFLSSETMSLTACSWLARLAGGAAGRRERLHRRGELRVLALRPGRRVRQHGDIGRDLGILDQAAVEAAI